MIKPIKIYWLLFMILCGSCTCVQGQETTYADIFRSIEARSSFVFNFNEAEAEMFAIDFNQSDNYDFEYITELINASPFDATINTNNVIILPVKKRKVYVCGKVISSNDWYGLPAALLLIDNENIGTTTDLEGAFNDELEVYKNAKCTISYLGYQALTLNVQDLADCPEISLEPQSEFIKDPVVIKAYIKAGIEDGLSFGSQMIKSRNRVPVLQNQEQDMFRTLQILPGISSPDDGAVGLNIRGSHDDQNLVTWEGVTLYDQSHFFGMISAVNPYDISQIQVFKSTHSAIHDNRIGGVINIDLDDKLLRKPKGSIGFNTTEAHLNLSIPIVKNRLGLHLSGRQSLFGVWKGSPTFKGYAQKIFQTTALFDEQEEEEENEEEELENEASSIDYKDINIKAIWQPNDKLQVSTSYLYSNNLNIGVQRIEKLSLEGNDALESRTKAFSNNWKYTLNEKSAIDLSLSFSDYSHMVSSGLSDLIDSSAILASSRFNSISDKQLNIKYTHDHGNHKSIIGFAADKKDVLISEEVEEIFRDSILNEEESTGEFHHLFAEQYYANKYLNLQYGLRTTYAHELDKIFLSPSLSVRTKIIDDLFYKFNAGYYQQFIHQRYETIDSDFNLENKIWVVNDDEDAPILEAGKISTGLVLKKNDWLVDLEVYYHKTSGVTAEDPNVRNSFLADEQNTIVSSGLDFLISKRWANYDFALYYSLADNTVNIPTIVIEDGEEEIETIDFVTNSDQPNIVKWVNTYRFDQLKIGLSMTYKSGLPFSNTDQITIDPSEAEDEYELIHTSLNNDRLPDYYRLDINALYSYRWSGINFEAGISLLNIMDRENIGSRKIILTDAGNEDAPKIQNFNKALLPRTLVASCRMFF